MSTGHCDYRPLLLTSLLWTACSDHTLVATVKLSRDSADTTPILTTDTAVDSAAPPDTAVDSAEPVDSGEPAPERLEGTINLAEGGWTASRVGELTAFQPKIDLAVADLNGDNAAEVIVGAPGWLDPTDAGAVYVSAGPLSGSKLLADEVRLEGGDRTHYAGFTVDVGTPASAEYPVLAIGSHESVPDVFLMHGPITASSSLTAPDGSIQYRGVAGAALWAGRDLTWVTHSEDTWLLVGNPLSLEGRGAIHVHAGEFTGTINENGIGIIGGPTQREEDNPPRLSCSASTTDVSGAPVVFAATPGVAGSAGAVFRVPIPGAASSLPVELDDTTPDNYVVGNAPGEMIGVFDDGWRCLLETGDITGDGVEDLVIGAPHTDNDAGAAWVLDGAAPWGGGPVAESNALVASVIGEVPVETTTTSTCEGSCVGYGVELGDWDGDGVAELFVGRIRDFGTTSSIWYGPVSGSLVARSGEAGSPHVVVKGSGTEAKFADADGDGKNELFVAEGSKQYDDAGTAIGQGGVWVVPGL